MPVVARPLDSTITQQYSSLNIKSIENKRLQAPQAVKIVSAEECLFFLPTAMCGVFVIDRRLVHLNKVLRNLLAFLAG